MLTFLAEFFRFFQRRRERLNAERAAERAHQLALVDAIASRLMEVAKSQNAGLVALAGATEAQAKVMANWFDSFKVDRGTERPTIADKEEWEYDSELAELASELPPEFALALQLQSQHAENFDREGSDF